MQLTFDFSTPAPTPAMVPGPACDSTPFPETGVVGNKVPCDEVLTRKVIRGRSAHLTGKAAEENVARAYRDAGYDILHQRYRGAHGEIDLIAKRGSVHVFVEVKASRTHRAAMERITAQQVRRIHASAIKFMEGTLEGARGEVRYDAATCDGTGAVKVHPGVLAHLW